VIDQEVQEVRKALAALSGAACTTSVNSMEYVRDQPARGGALRSEPGRDCRDARAQDGVGLVIVGVDLEHGVHSETLQGQGAHHSTSSRGLKVAPGALERGSPAGAPPRAGPPLLVRPAALCVGLADFPVRWPS